MIAISHKVGTDLRPLMWQLAAVLARQEELGLRMLDEGIMLGSEMQFWLQQQWRYANHRHACGAEDRGTGLSRPVTPYNLSVGGRRF